MNLRDGRRKLGRTVVTAAWFLLVVNCSSGQMAPTPQPDKVSNRVLQLAAEGKIDEAEQTLQAALTQCRQAGAPPNCSALLTFTQAYLAQQKGAAGTAEARELYSRVLNADPGNGAALNNLALVEDSVGNALKAEELWGKAIMNDPERAGHYALLLGDHFLRLQNTSDALKAYESAERFSPTAAAPRRRIVSTYRQMEGIGGLEGLEGSAKEWELTDPSNARAAYELLMSRWSSNSSSVNKADKILVRWGTLLARNDWLNGNSLSFLPENWKTPAIQELLAYMEAPAQRPQWNWWHSTPDRYGATFEFARDVGRLQLRSGKEGIQKAQSCFQWVLQSVTPGDLMGSKSEIDGYLRVSQELASLYFDHPELDPGNEKFSEMLARLYEGKMLAIEVGDRRISQAYHTTLAYIYVSRGIWRARPGTPGYMSAAYQLQAVLDDAAIRERTEGNFQPLAEIKDMLARAFVESGDGLNARNMSFSASLAYLDSDAIKDSQRLLEQSASFGAKGPEVTRVQQIIAARLGPENIRLDQLNSEKASWLFMPSEVVPVEFLKRQQFKIYGDLLNSITVGPQHLTVALRAYQLVVDYHTNLVGAGDLLRWQGIESALLRSTNGEPMPTRVVAYNSDQTKAGPRTELPISLAGDDRPNAVAVQQETPTAVEVLRAVGVSKVHEIQPYIRLRRGQLFIAPELGSVEADPIIQQLKNDPMLRAVIKPGVAPS